VYVNQTHITCTSPSIPDDPLDISREPVEFKVSMNGFDFDDSDKSLTFTFVGKATGATMLMYLILFILLGVLIGGVVALLQGWWSPDWQQLQNLQNRFGGRNNN
jgi:hypothetical protein